MFQNGVKMEITSFHLKLKADEVLAMTGCREGNPLYRSLKHMLQILWKEKMKVFAPKAYIKRMLLGNEIPVYACLFTLGESVTEEIAKLQEKDMMQAFLLDALSNQLIFQMDVQLQERIRELCLEGGHGISQRMEAPVDYPLEQYPEILKAFACDGENPVHLTSGYMLQPEKSMLICYRITEERTCMELTHDCAKCKKTDCMMRQTEQRRC